MTEIKNGELYIVKGPSKEDFLIGGNPIKHWDIMGSQMKKLVLKCVDDIGFISKNVKLYTFQIHQTPDGKDCIVVADKVIKRFQLPTSWVRNIEKRKEEDGWVLCISEGENIILEAKREIKTKN